MGRVTDWDSSNYIWQPMTSESPMVRNSALVLVGEETAR